MMLKITAAAALLAASLSASAMTAINDQDLSAVAGQDGVSIAADLNINIGAFTYTDKDSTYGAGSVSFNNITVKGMMIMTIDVLSANAFQAAAMNSLTTNYGQDAATAKSILGAVATGTGWTGQDVVQFAFPTVNAAAHNVTPTITIDSITTGSTALGQDANGNAGYYGAHTDGTGASFGSITIKNLDLQGTKVWMYGHN